MQKVSGSVRADVRDPPCLGCRFIADDFLYEMLIPRQEGNDRLTEREVRAWA